MGHTSSRFHHSSTLDLDLGWSLDVEGRRTHVKLHDVVTVLYFAVSEGAAALHCHLKLGSGRSERHQTYSRLLPGQKTHFPACFLRIFHLVNGSGSAHATDGC